jgi:oligoribonuclease NrnB/cAMP/cGMP phosphodiesterase (DHH superfamily)
MIEQAAFLVVLDHHKTAQKAMQELSQRKYDKPVMFVFDMERSGAGIARDYFQYGLTSWLVDYTQDRDLWRFSLPDSHAVNAFIGTLAPMFDAYEYVHENFSISEATAAGAGALAYKNMYVSKMVEHAQLVTFDGHPSIPLVNVPYVGVSEVVGKLAEAALFAVGWFQRQDGKVAISLRSRGDFDVSALAERHGGGGHKNAAGFQLDVPIHTFLTPVIG